MVRSILTIPVDFVVVSSYVVLTWTLVTQLGASGPLVRLVGIPVVLFLPGYALLSVLYPAEPTAYRRSGAETTTEHSLHGNSLSWPIRVAVSFGASLIIIPVVGLVLSVSRLGLETDTVAAAMVVVILVLMALGTVRRLRVPSSERYEVPYSRWMGTIRRSTTDAPATTDAILNVTLSLMVLVVVVGLLYGFTTFGAGGQQSELYLLQESQDGELVTAGFDEPFERGERRPITVGIANHEGRTVTYAVVAEVQRVSESGDDTVVEESEEIDRFRVTLENDERTRERRSVSTSLTGQELRVTYYLYLDEPPDDPSTETAAQSVYVWIDVQE